MIVDGKQVASRLKLKIQEKLKDGKERKVCFVIFGDDQGSRQFISMKRKFSESLGIGAEVLEYHDNPTFPEVKKIIDNIVSKNFSGIVVQLPLPRGLIVREVLNLIPPESDIDMLSEKSKELYKEGLSKKIPPVARAVLEILKFYNIGLNGKKILVVGKGRLVGEPVGNMLKLKKIEFQNIEKETDKTEKIKLLKEADIIISGAGDSYFIKPEMIRQGVVIIDAGTSEQEGKIVGDADPRCAEKALLITPVPNGVGPVTMASLFMNIE